MATSVIESVCIIQGPGRVSAPSTRMFSVRSRRSGARLGEAVPTTAGVAAVVVARAGGVGEAGESTWAVGLWVGSAVGIGVCTGEETGRVGVVSL